MNSPQRVSVPEEVAKTAEAGAQEAGNIVAFLRHPENAARFEAFRRLNRISNTRAAWSIVRQWLGLAASIAMAIRVGHAWSYAIAILVISTRQHALGVIMHEATHYRLFTSRWANEVLGDLLCAFPVNMSVSRYRHDHLLHHKYNMSQLD